MVMSWLVSKLKAKTSQSYNFCNKLKRMQEASISPIKIYAYNVQACKLRRKKKTQALEQEGTNLRKIGKLGYRNEDIRKKINKL